MPITTLFIDAGGVLVVPNWKRVSQVLGAHGVSVAAETLEAADPYARRDLDLSAGTNAGDQRTGWVYFELVLGHAGVPLSAATGDALADLQAYHAEWNLWESIPEGVPEALRRLRGLGLKLVVVSNANGRLRLLLDRLGLAPAVDLALDSAEEGVEKPDPRLFELALNRSKATAETTLHVGDLFHVDVEGARAAGIRAMLLDPLDLYAGFDCERVKSLGELADRLAAARNTVEAGSHGEAPKA